MKVGRTSTNVATMSSPAPLHVSRSANRALTLLDTIVSAGSMKLGEAAEVTAMPPSTALRHLRALVGGGWLSRDDSGRYSTGPTLFRLALRTFTSGPLAELTAAAQPHLAALVDATQESAYLAVRDGRSAVYISTVESPRAIRHVGSVGKEAPLIGTAVGASLLADVDRSAPPPVATNTGASEPDVTAVTVPIHDGTDVVAAFSVLGPADRLDAGGQRVAGEALVAASTALSAQLRDAQEAGPT